MVMRKKRMTRKTTRRPTGRKMSGRSMKKPGMTKSMKAGERREIKDAKQIKKLADKIIKYSEKELKH